MACIVSVAGHSPRPQPTPRCSYGKAIAPSHMQRFRREWWWLGLEARCWWSALLALAWHERQQTERRERQHLAQQARMLHDNLVPQLGAINRAGQPAGRCAALAPAPRQHG